MESASDWEILCFETSFASSLSDRGVSLCVYSHFQDDCHRQIAFPCPERLVKCPPMSPELGLSAQLQAQYLDPDLLESAMILIHAKSNGVNTICPAPTTPSLFTSAAANLELELKDRRVDLLKAFVNCLPASIGEDILRTRQRGVILNGGIFNTRKDTESSDVLPRLSRLASVAYFDACIGLIFANL